MQACPHPCLESASLGGTYDGDPYAEMKNAGLDSVSFQEYHPRFPHEKYTVGLAGRPHSGPEFYVNLLNNTLDHGPAELRKKELVAVLGAEENEREPDPCFGKVVEGFDVVDKIAERMTRAALPKPDEDPRNDALDDSLLVRPVRIVSVTIVEKDAEVQRRATEMERREEL